MIRKLLWGVIIVTILLSFPSFIERVKVENSNKAYEIAVPYQQIKEVMKLREGVGIPKEVTLEHLINMGVHTVGIEPLTIEEMEDLGIVRTITKDVLLIDYRIPKEDLPSVSGLFLEVVEEDHPYVDLFVEAFQLEYELSNKSLLDEGHKLVNELSIEQYSVNGRTIYFLPNATKVTTSLPLGYHMDEVKEIIDAGLKVIPRISNEMSFIDYEDHFIYKQLEELSELGADKILFLGDEVVGHEKTTEELEQFTAKLKQYGLNVGVIEFADQSGMAKLLSRGELEDNVIRTFSLTIGNEANEKYKEEINKAIRAVKERNIRLLYVNLLKPEQSYYNVYEAEEGIERLRFVVGRIINDMPNDFRMTDSRTFTPFAQNPLIHIAVLIATIAFVVLFINKFLPSLTTLAAAGMVFVGVLQVVTGHSLLLKALALAVTVTGAIYAVLSIEAIASWKNLLLQYARSIVIAGISIWLLTQLLYGTEFVTKVDQFTGVKILAGLPFLVGIVLLYRDQLKTILQHQVRYWHLVIFVILGVVFAYYVIRTGNDAAVLGIELRMRQLLEDILYVRPRTTEFLIGFPMFFLGLYLHLKKKKYAKMFLAVGFLAFASMIGTFTHLHTPIFISLLRTIYGIGFGTLIGTIFIFIHNFIERKIYPELKSRWQ